MMRRRRKLITFDKENEKKSNILSVIWLIIIILALIGNLYFKHENSKTTEDSELTNISSETNI